MAYDAVEGALAAGSFNAVPGAIRPDLEVLDRDQLLAVAVAMAAECAWALTPVRDRERLRRRLGERRLEVMLADD